MPRTLKAHVILSGPEHCVKPWRNNWWKLKQSLCNPWIFLCYDLFLNSIQKECEKFSLPATEPSYIRLQRIVLPALKVPWVGNVVKARGCKTLLARGTGKQGWRAWLRSCDIQTLQVPLLGNNFSCSSNLGKWEQNTKIKVEGGVESST